MSAAVLTAETDRDTWLAERRGYLGGTDIAAIVGKNRYKTPLEVYYDKTEGKASESSRQAEAGLALEPLIRVWAEKDLGFEIAPGKRILDPEIPFLGANPDGFVGDHAIAEFKTHGFGTSSEWGEEATDEVPDAYHIQCMWYLGLTGRESCYLYRVDLARMEPHVHLIAADTEYFGLLREEGVRFWRSHIEPKIPPAVTDRRDEDLLRARHDKPVDNILLADSATDALAETLIEASRARRAVCSTFDDLKTRMMAVIGDYSAIETAFGRITFRSDPEKRVTDWELIARELKAPPAMVEAHTVIKPGSRRFLLPKEAK